MGVCWPAAFQFWGIMPGCMIFPLARLGVFCHFAGLDDFPFFVWGFGLVYLWPHLGQAPNFAWGELACLSFGHDAYRPPAFQCFGTFARLHDFSILPGFSFFAILPGGMIFISRSGFWAGLFLASLWASSNLC